MSRSILATAPVVHNPRSASVLGSNGHKPVALVGGGIGTCWAHVGSIVLGSARQGEGVMTASLIPTTQTFAVSMGAALSGIIANAAGLSGGASRPVAALAAAWLFGTFLLSPLAALAIAWRLAAPRGAERGRRGGQAHA